MKAKLMLMAVLLCLSLPIFATGVMVTGQYNNLYYPVFQSEISVDIEDQVAIITSKQLFSNNQSANTPKYIFPMPEGASATQLRWNYNDVWHVANFAPVPQDSLPPNPPTGWPDNLQSYMGSTPLFFNIPHPVAMGADIQVELTYVMLLPYSWGSVNFAYPLDYSLIQNTAHILTVNCNISSQRTIMSVSVGGLDVNISNDGNYASFNYEGPSENSNLAVSFALDPEQFGLYSLSTQVDEVPDELPEGFFVFIAEPDPGNSSAVINKTFSLIVDTSGSMTGQRIINARNAARYIVEHLNPNDMFNIIEFNTMAEPLWPQHMVANSSNTSTAINWINTFLANGMTNMSHAFSTTVPQFYEANPENASIIIFITDGEPTEGITDTPGLRQHVHNLIQTAPMTINLFTFGVGASYSQQLLTLLATDNDGSATFVSDSDFETAITEFYNLIANPVLLYPTISFSPTSQISEVYPNPLPNVYQGSQMMVSGRYVTGGPSDLTLIGQNYEAQVTYDYSMDLADSLITDKQFLTKIWAKMKIEYLLTQYYSCAPNSMEAEAFKQMIIDVSLAYGVLSPFTSLTGEGVSNEEDSLVPDISSAYTLKGNFPNPFNPSTTIRFSVNKDVSKLVKVRVYNLRGQLVKTLALNVDGKGDYEIIWDGRDMHGKQQPSAIYFYVIDFGDAQLSGRMTMSK
jgi:Ca-activated chloride channel homolog